MNPPRRILVVDDEPDVRRLVQELLARAGHAVVEATSGQEALDCLHEAQPDLIVLDVSMPGMDGWQALARIRDVTDVPVLMLTAHGGELERVRGLRAGADDYVVKPFGRQEWLARVDALLRRVPRRSAEPDQTEYEHGPVKIDLRNARVDVNGREVRLTPLEFRLLMAFVRNPGEVLGRERLLELVWGDTGVASDQVKLYIGYLRKKLAQAMDADEPSPIETVRGFGYRWSA